MLHKLERQARLGAASILCAREVDVDNAVCVGAVVRRVLWHVLGQIRHLKIDDSPVGRQPDPRETNDWIVAKVRPLSAEVAPPASSREVEHHLIRGDGGLAWRI